MSDMVKSELVLRIETESRLDGLTQALDVINRSANIDDAAEQVSALMGVEELRLAGKIKMVSKEPKS